METLVVNFAAGPGTGKSTTAASIFARLKRVGINCELALEFAKEKVWEKNRKIFDDQLYIMGKQHWKLHRLQGEVDVILTDSPLFLSVAYNQKYGSLDKLVLEAFNYFNNLNIFLERSKPYEPKGRNQTLEEAKVLDQEIRNLMLDHGIAFETYKTSVEDELAIAEKILILIDRKDLIEKLYEDTTQDLTSETLDHFLLLLLQEQLTANALTNLVEKAKDRVTFRAPKTELWPYIQDLSARLLEK